MKQHSCGAHIVKTRTGWVCPIDEILDEDGKPTGVPLPVARYNDDMHPLDFSLGAHHTHRRQK